MDTVHITKPGWLCTCGASQVCEMPYVNGLTHAITSHPNGEVRLEDHNPTASVAQ